MIEILNTLQILLIKINLNMFVSQIYIFILYIAKYVDKYNTILL